MLKPERSRPTATTREAGALRSSMPKVPMGRNRCRSDGCHQSSPKRSLRQWRADPGPPLRRPSHVEVAAALARRGVTRIGLGRLCKALHRLGIAHCEDATQPQHAEDQPAPRVKVITCDACRGLHSKRVRDDTCRLDLLPGRANSGPARPPRSQAALGSQRVLQAGEAGPYF